MSRLLCLLGLLLLIVPGAASAQTVRGTITGERSGHAVAGAFVAVETTAGVREAAALTAADGSYSVRLRGAGTYRLRIERLGLQTQVGEAFTVGMGETSVQDVKVAEQAMLLPEIAVRASSRGCRASGELAADAAALWEEARKALTVAAWTAGTQSNRMLIERSLRERRVGGTRYTLQVQDSTVLQTSGSPWQSAPAAELAQRGYVRREGAGYLYFGPDADLLLSDSFLETHCFEVTHDAARGLAGLRFQPRGSPKVTDIRGVLWLRSDSLLLHSLDFTYVNLPYRVSESVGGTVGFQRLPSGAWIVNDWRVRAPRPLDPQLRVAVQTLVMSEQRYRVYDVLDTGGLSLLGHDAASAEAAVVADLQVGGGSTPGLFWAAQRCEAAPGTGHAHAAGRVSDTTGSPLARVVVRLTVSRRGQWVVYDTETDGDGLYRLCNVPLGLPTRIEAVRGGYHTVARELGAPAAQLLRHDFALQPERTTHER